MENNTEVIVNGNGPTPAVSVTESSPTLDKEKKTSGATTASINSNPSRKSSMVVTNEPKRRVSIASDPVAEVRGYDNLAYEPNPKGRKISQVKLFFCYK